MKNVPLCVYFIFLECLVFLFYLQGLCYLVSYRTIYILPLVLFKNSIDNSTFILVFYVVSICFPF